MKANSIQKKKKHSLLKEIIHNASFSLLSFHYKVSVLLFIYNNHKNHFKNPYSYKALPLKTTVLTGHTFTE